MILSFDTGISQSLKVSVDVINKVMDLWLVGQAVPTLVNTD